MMGLLRSGTSRFFLISDEMHMHSSNHAADKAQTTWKPHTMVTL